MQPSVNDRIDQGGFAVKVRVQRGLAHAGRRGDLIHCGLVKATLCEQAGRCTQNGG